MIKEEIVMWVMNQFQAMGGATVDELMGEQRALFASTAYLLDQLHLLGALTHNQPDILAFGRSL